MNDTEAHAALLGLKTAAFAFVRALLILRHSLSRHLVLRALITSCGFLSLDLNMTGPSSLILKLTDSFKLTSDRYRASLYLHFNLQNARGISTLNLRASKSNEMLLPDT